MKKISLLISCFLLASTAFAQIPKYEIGFQGALWNSIWNANGRGPGSVEFLRNAGTLDFQNYPFNFLDMLGSERVAEYDQQLGMIMLRAFGRKNFTNFYLQTGLNYTQEPLVFLIPFSINPNHFDYSRFDIQFTNFEIPLYIGHRLEFLENIRVYAGVVPTFASTIGNSPSLPRIDAPSIDPILKRDLENTLGELRQNLTDSYKRFYLNGSAGIGLDYKLLSIDFQIDRSLSMSRSSTPINNVDVGMDERKTRRMLWIGFRIPIN